MPFVREQNTGLSTPFDLEPNLKDIDQGYNKVPMSIGRIELKL